MTIRKLCEACNGKGHNSAQLTCMNCAGWGLEPHRTLDIQEPELGMQVDLTMNGFKYTGDLTQIRLNFPTDGGTVHEVVLGLTLRPVK